MRIRRSRRLAVRPRSQLRPNFVGLGALAVVLALWSAPVASSHQSIPIAGPSTALQGVTCISRSDCWAVGVLVNKAGAGLDQAEHWNGKKWKRVSTPDPGGKASGDRQQLSAVSCISRSDCWAVGSYTDSASQARLDQALHWNGKRWKLVATPQPAAPSSNDIQQLSGVSCVSRSDCWAVGSAGVLGAAGLNQALRWNGTKWSSVRVPEPGGKSSMATNSLRGIACVRASDCWAVGTYRNSSEKTFNQALRYNGRRWKVVSTPNRGTSSGMGLPAQGRQLSGVACLSATVCRAVGSYPKRSGETVNQALRFNGKKWLVMSTPDPGGTTTMHMNVLAGISCTAASDCWAVGQVATPSGARNQALKWDGKKWSAVFTPNPGGKGAKDRNQLGAIACASSKDCWAVGSEKNATATTASDQMLHWNGRKWKTG